jgi:hypothetical protein
MVLELVGYRIRHFNWSAVWNVNRKKDQITSLRHMIRDSYKCGWTVVICHIARYVVWDIIMCSYESSAVGDWALSFRKEFLNTPLLTSVVHPTSNRKDIYSPLDKALGQRFFRAGQLLQVSSNSTAHDVHSLSEETCSFLKSKKVQEARNNSADKDKIM